MGQSNAYFKLDIQPEGTFLMTFPPGEGGTIIELSEVTSYLNRHNCNNYDLKELNRAILMSKACRIKVGDIYPVKVNEEMDTRVSLDKMLVSCRFFPESEDGSQITAQEIIRNLNIQNIRVGIKQDEILKFLNDRAYCTDFLLASGKAPVNGKDARIEYYFNTNLNMKPKKNDDGTVDYHQLNVISHVDEGDCLARLYQAEEGRPGSDVYGNEVKPRAIKNLKLEFGKNITLSEDKLEIYSDVTGHASLVNDKVFVSDVYEVPADVDNSTGNIDYQGNVTIKGNVKGGFSVVARGDVIVEGVVEDSVIQAGGQIIVKRGIHGMTKGILKASGNVICKFIENATVISGGYIETESILHSKVAANSEVRVNGRKGFITGGVISAGNLVEAQTIGSSLGANTRIEVGVDPEKKSRFTELQQFIQQTNKAIDQLKPILLTYGEKMAKGEALSKEKIKYVEQLAQAMKTKETEVKNVQEEYNQLHALMLHNSNAKVRVSKTIYAGVVVSISEVSLTLQEDRSFCQLVRDQGEIKIITM